MGVGNGPGAGEGRLEVLLKRLELRGVRLRLSSPGTGERSVGPDPPLCRVEIGDRRALRALLRGNHLALAEAFLEGRVRVHGDLLQALAILEWVDLAATRRARWRLALRLATGSRRLRRQSVAFHYDRPVEFFLPWLERWRSYSHGLYASSEDDPTEAQARKMQRAIDSLGLERGMRVLDVGCGWGAFLEYAGLQGICVHGITLSRRQHAFVEALIREQALPCSVERIDFFDFRPERPFDGSVFMGSLEHLIHIDQVTVFLSRYLAPEARVWADFCAQRRDPEMGAFMARYIWPGSTRYVQLQDLVRSLVRAGFNVHEVTDDTSSYAWTVRDWADALDDREEKLSREFGAESVRAFRLYLRASQLFLASNRTQAYHVVAGRGPAPLPGAGRRAPRITPASAAATQTPANVSPSRE